MLGYPIFCARLRSSTPMGNNTTGVAVAGGGPAQLKKNVRKMWEECQVELDNNLPTKDLNAEERGK